MEGDEEEEQEEPTHPPRKMSAAQGDVLIGLQMALDESKVRAVEDPSDALKETATSNGEAWTAVEAHAYLI